MNDWFEWNGTRCTEYGIYVSEQPPVTIPQERSKQTTIPGRPGRVMLMPSIFGENLFDEFFGDWDREMRRMDRQLYGRNAAREMKTDVHEHEDHYEVDIDLPGFKKEDITLELQNGYLTVTASKGLDKDKTTKKGKVIRQERWAGTLQRSFYVGDALTEADIGAKLEHGVLSLNIPKKDEKKLPEKKVIMIEG